MKFISLNTIFILLLLTSSCGESKKQKGNNHVPIINIEESVGKMEVVNLSRFAIDIRYLPLETHDNMIFTGLWDSEFSDSLFIAKDLNKCLLYDYSGKFRSAIGSLGRGPGEFQNCLNVSITSGSKIYIQSLYDLYVYYLDGKFLKKFKNAFLFDDDYVASWYPLNDSVIFGKISSALGNEVNKALLFKPTGEIISEFKNYIIFKREHPVAATSEYYANIFHFRGQIIFKEPFNDTVFYLSDKNKLIPSFIVNLGKYTTPLSERQKLWPDENNYIIVTDVFQTNDYLFLECFFGSNFPAKRLTPEILTLPNSVRYERWYNTRYVLAVFNKTTHNLILCKPSSTDNPLATSGLYNDIDAGPRFFPKKMVNDSTMVMWIDAKRLKDHVTSDDFRKNIPKYPGKKKELEELANRLTELDNPVLMFVTFKK
jgi:hypothetical protein